MLVTLSGIFTLVRAVQLSNALLPMRFTPLGIVIHQVSPPYRILDKCRAGFVEQNAVYIFIRRIALGDRDTCKAFAIFKRPIANARHAGGNRHARKSGAISKRIIANARHAVGDRDARKSCAISKRIIANALHAGANRDAHKISAIVKLPMLVTPFSMVTVLITDLLLYHGT